MNNIISEITDFEIKKAVRVIDDGGVICFPTETVYALAADASNEKAVERLYEIKKRDINKPLSLLVGDIYQANRIAEFNDNANKLALMYFPGPLTLVLKIKQCSNIAKNVNQDIGTIGVRIPSNILSLKILKAIGRPIVGTSVNISGGKSATSVEDVINSGLDKKIDLIFDQGESDLGLSSTVVDLTGSHPKIIREGVILESEILEMLEVAN